MPQLPHHMRDNRTNIREAGRDIPRYNGGKIKRSRNRTNTRYDQYLLRAIDNDRISPQVNTHYKRYQRKYLQERYENDRDVKHLQERYGSDGEYGHDDLRNTFNELMNKYKNNRLDLQNLNNQGNERQYNHAALNIQNKGYERQYSNNIPDFKYQFGTTGRQHEKLNQRELTDEAKFLNNSYPISARFNLSNIARDHQEVIMNNDRDESVRPVSYPEDFECKTGAYSKTDDKDECRKSRYTAQVNNSGFDSTHQIDHTVEYRRKQDFRREPTKNSNVYQFIDDEAELCNTNSPPESYDPQNFRSRTQNFIGHCPGNTGKFEKSYNKPISCYMRNPIQRINNAPRNQALGVSNYQVGYSDRAEDSEPYQKSRAEIGHKVTYRKMLENRYMKRHEIQNHPYEFEDESSLSQNNNMDNGPKLRTRARKRYLSQRNNLEYQMNMDVDIQREFQNKSNRQSYNTKSIRKLESTNTRGQPVAEPYEGDFDIVRTRTTNQPKLVSNSFGQLWKPVPENSIHCESNNVFENGRLENGNGLQMEIKEEHANNETQKIRNKKVRIPKTKSKVPPNLQRKLKKIWRSIETENIEQTEQNPSDEAFNEMVEKLKAQLLKIQIRASSETRLERKPTLTHVDMLHDDLMKIDERKDIKSIVANTDGRIKESKGIDRQVSNDEISKIRDVPLKVGEKVVFNQKTAHLKEKRTKSGRNTAIVAVESLKGEQNAADAKQTGHKSGTSKKAAFDLKDEEIIRLLNHIKVLLMSPEINEKVSCRID